MEDYDSNRKNRQVILKSNKFLSNRIPLSYIIILLSFCFTLFIFAPYEIFFTQIDNFKFSIYDIIPFTLLLFIFSIVGLAIGFQILTIISKKLSQYLITLLFGITVALYVQGNYLRTDYGLLNGKQVDWSLYFVDGIISALFWILSLSVLFLILLKYKYPKCEKFISTISLCVVLVQIVTLVIVGITSDGFRVKREYVTTTKNEFSMSKNKNLVVLVLDTLDSEVLNDVLEDNDGSFYKDILKDFTFYRNTTGMYEFTDLAIPYILSGKEYKKEESYEEYIETAYNQSEILNHQSANDWIASVYTTTKIPQKPLDIRISNIKNVELTVSSHRKLAEFLYRFVGYRYLPFHLKKLCWFYPDDVDNLISIKDCDLAFFEWSNYYFDWDMPTMTTDEKKNTFHFYHLEGTHIPFTINADFTGSDGETSVTDETKGIMILVKHYIDLLKEKGIYDNTAIVILGDHGYVDRGQFPTLLIKGMNDSKEFEVSDLPISYADLQNAFIKLTEGTSGSYLFMDSNQTEKERYFYSYNFTEGTDKQEAELQKFQIIGDLFDNEFKNME